MSFSARWRFVRAIGITLAHSTGVLGAAAVGQLRRGQASRRYWDWCEALCRLGGVDLHVEGADRLPPGRGWLFMSNHRSYWDIPSIGFGLKPIPLRMVAKRDLFKVPLWGPAMRKAEILPLDRSDRAAAIRDLDVAADKLRGGLSVWIAPEGTRSRDGALGHFKKGGFMLALKTGAPIVPVGVAGTERVAPVDRFELTGGGPVAVVVGEPIDVAPYIDGDDGRDRLMQEVRTAMTRLVARAEQIVSQHQGVRP